MPQPLQLPLLTQLRFTPSHNTHANSSAGLNNIAPNSSNPLPNLSPVKGLATVCLDNSAKAGTWDLVLCHFTKLTGGYIQAHVSGTG